MFSVEFTGVDYVRQLEDLAFRVLRGHEVLDLHLCEVPDPHPVRRPSSAYSIGATSKPRFSPIICANISGGPPSSPGKTARSLSACSSVAAASMNHPRRQLPSAITAGVSPNIVTFKPLTSTPSTSPESM